MTLLARRDEDPMPYRAAPTVAFALALTLLFTLLGLVATWREGSGDYPLTWDSAVFQFQALTIHREMAAGGLRGLAQAWMHTSGTHSPLVPTLSAFSMAIFGESRAAADAVLPLFVFIFIFSVARCCEWLFVGRVASPRAAAWTAAFLAMSFPMVTYQSRIYLYEFPLAAMTAATLWTGLATRQFTSRRASLACGIVAGLAAVSRAGGPVLLAGPGLVLLGHALREKPRAGKIVNIALAAVVAGALAASWYAPNFRELRDYIYSVTYGDMAGAHTVSGSSFTADSVLYTLTWTVLDGPGVPMLVVGFLALLRARCFAGSKSASLAAWLAVALCIDFLLVIVASQRAGGVLMLAAMPLAAALLSLAAYSVPSTAACAGFVILLLGTGIHHVYGTSFGFSKQARGEEGFGPFGSKFRLWNHQNLFLGIAGPAAQETRWNNWLDETCTRLEKSSMGATVSKREPLVFVMVNTPFFQCNSLQLNSALRGRDWRVRTYPFYPKDRVTRDFVKLQLDLQQADAIVVRKALPRNENEFDRMIQRLLQGMIGSKAPTFLPLGEPMPFYGGDSLQIYTRIPDFVWRTEPDPTLERTNLQFTHPAGAVAGSFRLSGARCVRDAGQCWLELQVESLFVNGEFPPLYIDITETDGRIASRTDFPADRLGDIPRAPTVNSFGLVRISLLGALPPQIAQRGFAVLLSVGGETPPRRWNVEGSGKVNLTEKTAWILEVPPVVR
jgi:hypothetical protein